MASTDSKPAKNKKAWADKSVLEKVKTVLLVLVVLIVLITLKGLIFGGPDDKQPATGQRQTVDTNAPVDKQLEQIVHNASDKDDVRQVRATEQVGGGYGVFVQIYDKSVRTGILGEQMADIYKALYTSGKDVRTASIVAISPLIDKYGNDADVPVYKTTLDKETADKVNWKADEAVLQYRILPGVWTLSDKHQVLKD